MNRVTIIIIRCARCNSSCAPWDHRDGVCNDCRNLERSQSPEYLAEAAELRALLEQESQVLRAIIATSTDPLDMDIDIGL